MTISINLDIGSIVNAIVWPVLAGILLVKYRTEIKKFIDRIVKDSEEFSIGSFKVKFANTKSLTPKWGQGNMDLRNAGISGFSSYASDLLKQIDETSQLDYAVFDLGHGNNWLSSRFYLFTVILNKMRGLRAIVFVDSNQGIENHFVGFAKIEQVEDVLFRTYPTYAKAFLDNFLQIKGPTISKGISLDSQNVSVLADSYLNSIRYAAPPGVPPQPNEGYVSLNYGIYENAEWLNTGKIEEIFAGIIDKSSINEVDLKTRSKEDQLRLILAFEGPFVAMLNQKQEFVTLIDRHRLAEEVARKFIQRKEEA